MRPEVESMHVDSYLIFICIDTSARSTAVRMFAQHFVSEAGHLFVFLPQKMRHFRRIGNGRIKS